MTRRDAKSGGRAGRFRLPADAAGLLAVTVVFLLLRGRAGTVAALFAGLFLAFSPIHAYHSSGIRYYGLVCLAGTVLLWGLLALEEGRTFRGAALAAAGLPLGMLAHMSFALAAAAAVGGYGLFALLHTRPRAALLRRLGGAGLVRPWRAGREGRRGRCGVSSAWKRTPVIFSTGGLHRDGPA